jgi:hypothetical protein
MPNVSADGLVTIDAHLGRGRDERGAATMRSSIVVGTSGTRRFRHVRPAPLFVGGLLSAIILAPLGFWADKVVRERLATHLAQQLGVVRNASEAALRLWLGDQLALVAALASSPAVTDGVAVMADGADELVRARLDQQVQRLTRGGGFSGYGLIDAEGAVVAGRGDMQRGDRVSPALASLCREAAESSRPTMGIDDSVSLPRLQFVAPAGGVGCLVLFADPRERFTQVLRVARAGESGETYAFDANGRLLSASRFEEELRRQGRLGPGESSVLRVRLAPPGGKGQLTKMAQRAVRGRPGTNTEGYADYRGVEVVGAWTWFPQYRFGIATEIDKREAFDALVALHQVFWGLFGLLCLTSVGGVVASIAMRAWRKRASAALAKAQQLGDYQLEQKIGEGAMGVVYRATHTMLRRPTALKLLRPGDDASQTAIARFEREVQLTSRLSHPNTIAIYDYGRTPEGQFYCAMELIDGQTLEQLVDRFGPLAPERAVYLLTQGCASLAEAHGMGLIHRDIKPANLMVSRRAGEHDVLKVLDFGLVKPVSGELNMTRGDLVLGTPNYMSPEALQGQQLDCRTDLYALGGVAFYMLTGRAVFEATTLMELCTQHISAPRPDVRDLAPGTPQDLAALIGKLLAKNRDERPADPEEVRAELERCSLAGLWDRYRARQWWEQRGGQLVTAAEPSAPLTHRVQVDMAGR